MALRERDGAGADGADSRPQPGVRVRRCEARGAVGVANRSPGRVSLRSGTGCGAPTLRQLQREGNCGRKAL